MPRVSLGSVSYSALTACLLVCLLCAVGTRAQNNPAVPVNQEQTTQQLLQRTSELEARVKQLEENQPAATPPPPSVPVPSPAPEPPPAAEQPQANVVADRLKLLLFGDTGYEVGHFYGPTNTFEFGEFDVFATARLTDRVSTLAEILFTANSNNRVSLDVERLLLTYRQNDYFAASIGRIHTAIGYYNTAFNRGDYFQTAIGRPEIYEFDDQAASCPCKTWESF